MRPILLPPKPASVNHSAPSGPAVIPNGSLAGVGTRYSLRLPEVVMRPSLLALASVNQSAPSGPAVIPNGSLAAVGTGNSVMVAVQAVGVSVGDSVGVGVGVSVGVGVGDSVGVGVGVSG